MSYYLISTVTFLTRFEYYTIDNIFIDTAKFEKYTVSSITNCLSDHNVQIITLHILYRSFDAHINHYSRKISNYTIAECQYILSCETWESIFNSDDANKIFTNFLNTYLRIFCSNFPLRNHKISENDNSWITTGTRISCKCKRILHTVCKNSNNSSIKNAIKTIMKFGQCYSKSKEITL